MSYRRADLALDGDAILTACRGFHAFAIANPEHYAWAGGVDFDTGLTSIEDTVRAGNGYLMGSYLVLVAEFTPWFSQQTLLQEWLVLRIYPDGDINDVPRGLQKLAADRGLDVVITADSSPVGFVAGAYKRADFKPLTTSFYKVLPSWDSSRK